MLESDSVRNNIHLNSKQKPEITNKNTGKITCQYGQSAGADPASKFREGDFSNIWQSSLITGSLL